MAAKSKAKSGEYQDGKLWFARQSSVVTLGITLNTAEELGEINAVELPGEGDDFDKGEVVAEVIGSNGKIEVIAPAAGLVQSVNDVLEEDPGGLADDPLEEGWIVKLEIQDTSDLEEYLERDEAD